MLFLNDKLLVDAALKVSPQRLSDYNFTNLWMWDSLRHYQLVQREGFLLIQFAEGNQTVFLYPLGEDDRPSLIKKLTQEHRPFRMRAIPEEALEELAFLPLTPEEDRFDYLYNFDDLLNLPGNAYQSKRNLIHQFERDYDFTFEEISEGNLPQVIHAEEKWFQEYGKEKKDMKWEHMAALRALENFTALDLRGGAIFVGNQIVAYSFGEYINPDILLIHEEKAFVSYHGAYQTINQQMLKHLPKVPFVNREEDLGKTNLHKVKESYHPVQHLKKYQILIN